MRRAGALLLLAALAGCGHEVGPAAGRAADPGADRARAGADREQGRFVGVLATRRAAYVATDLEARVDAIRVHMGDHVSPGDPLIELDDDAIQKALDGARAAADARRAARNSARLGLEDARHQLSLQRRLLRRGLVAREAVRSARVAVGQARNALSQASAACHQADAQVEELERQLAHATLTAPIAGVVSMPRVHEGEMVAPGTPMLRIFDPSELRVRFAVPADQVDEVELGQEVTLALRDSSRGVRGVVRHISPELEPPLRLVLVEAEVVGDDAGAELPIQSGLVGRVALADPPSE